MKSNMFKTMVTICLSAFIIAASPNKSEITEEQYVEYKNTGSVKTSINVVNPNNSVSELNVNEVTTSNLNSDTKWENTLESKSNQEIIKKAFSCY